MCQRCSTLVQDLDSSGVLGMTLNCIHILIVAGSFLYCHEAGQSAFLHSYTVVIIYTNFDHILFSNISWH